MREGEVRRYFKRVWADLIEPVGEVVVVRKGVVDGRTERVRERDGDRDGESVFDGCRYGMG